MKRGIAMLAGAALLFGLAATTASGSHGVSGGSPHEFAVGTAKNRVAEFSQSPFQLEVAAHRRFDGEVTGHVRGSGDLTGDLPGGDFEVEGEVTCLRVDPKPAAEVALTGPGTRASIKYVVKTSSGSAAPPEGWVIEVFVEDNGHSVNGEPVDANGALFPVPPELSDPSDCHDPNLAGQPYNPVDQGDYVVHDNGVE